ncbi:hypothetical protein L2719_14985 [Shewanella schlegeliana]|uniref:Lipoprotein n=1 Tax=Shewanella schlegeliana TaxID=190308 RepID=A0ABS1T021_9GAMM|nr:hypothetical protein [Shewanella schlegeliana]MBL4914123.1 hypothetical protein [Shewanella schlegeliana]MCL1110840.1 hypothetical protein [Shewanella schlegeliana]GIU36307.1 hypothetical protein TUM4433_34860 [Shewanella schlegeliana]
MNIRFEKFINLPYSLMVCCALVITACGGGGDDAAPETPAPVATTTTDPTTTPTPDPTPDPTSLDDLIVDADNKLESAYVLTINVDKDSTQRGYFSLCDDYQVQGNGYSVNFDSCLFRGPLNEGKLNKEVKVANHESQLIAVIWFYEGQAPQYSEWQYKQDTDSQVLSMN